MYIFVALLIGLLPFTRAIFADEAYTVDFHYALLGLPVATNTFFHRPIRKSKVSLLYTLSEKLVVGAVNPKDGVIVWRHALAQNQTSSPAFLRTASGLDSVITAVDDQISSWGGSDGRLSWERTFADSKVQSLELSSSPGMINTNVLLDQKPKALIKNFDADTGAFKWVHEDESGDVPFQLSASNAVLYYVSLQPALLKGFKIKVTAIDQSTGVKLDQRTLDGSVPSPDAIRFISSTSATPFMAWTEESNKHLKINVLGSKQVSSFDIADVGERVDITIISPRDFEAAPHFLVQYQSSKSHWAEVFHIDSKSSSVKRAYEFEKVDGKGTFSVSTEHEKVFFTRATRSELTLSSSISSNVLAQWPMQSSKSDEEQLYFSHASTEVVPRSETSFAVRSAMLVSNGDWALIRNGEHVWTRHESLAGVVKARWANFHQTDSLIEELEIEAQSNIVSGYFHRLKRHVQELQRIFSLAPSLPQLLLGGLPKVLLDQNAGDKDRFGFHKLIILATDNGRLIALDTGALGQILWNVKAVELEQGEKWNSSSVGSIPARISDISKSSTSVLSNLQIDVILEESDVVDSGFHSSPFSYFNLEDGVLYGLKDGNRVWSFATDSDQQIVSVSHAQNSEPISSIGKVLGDRTVLYKYLSPNNALVIATHISQPSITVYLLDSATGNILHSSNHDNVDASRPITSAVSENWFVYAFTTQASNEGASSGHQIVMAELYESLIPNDRGYISQNTSNDQSQIVERLSDKPHVLSQIFHIPEEISHMAITQTQQGITSRQLIVSLPASNAIVTIPRYVLDPRRLVGRDPTNEQMMEGITRYSPMVEFSPDWYLNHKEEIIGIQKIIVTPALLESTGIVFAYGLDLFGTRVTPSFAFDILGKSFNKVQLLLTVVALFIGTFLAAPFIQRKQTDALWSAS